MTEPSDWDHSYHCFTGEIKYSECAKLLQKYASGLATVEYSATSNGVRTHCRIVMKGRKSRWQTCECQAWNEMSEYILVQVVEALQKRVEKLEEDASLE